MKRYIIVTVLIILLVLWIGVALLSSREQYVAGRIYIRERAISAEIYTREQEPIDGMSTLWQGGTVTTDADLSNVQVGDFAHIYTTEGEHLVLECIDIRQGFALLMEPQGDVLVVNGRWVYRFTRL